MRVLIYSHDSFGLGHLRRCRTIAHALVEHFPNLSVIILSGSPIIGSFDFRARVDFIRIPGVIKLRNGEYTSLKLHLDISETLAIRESIIKHTAEVFTPDLFIVDKEPLGLHGEVESTLKILKSKGVPLVLGVRDVLDDPELLLSEWRRKKAIPALEKYYNQLWVYGDEELYNPFQDLSLSQSIKDKVAFTGYLKRKTPQNVAEGVIENKTNKPYMLVTTGGGGDGAMLVEAVLKAYEKNAQNLLDALIVLGPFMPPEQRSEFSNRAQKIDKISIITFDSHIEHLLQNAQSIVAMGGYNIFCEILSFDKPALLLPRTTPRKEQYIRAFHAQNLGLLTMISDEDSQDPDKMTQALIKLNQQPAPSSSFQKNILNGLDNICSLTEKTFRKTIPNKMKKVAS